MYLPPLRTVGFNGGLTLNDSLLAQSYVEAFDLSYPDALARIQSDTKKLREELDNQGCYEFGSLGTLSYNDEGNLVFEPSEAGILTPRLYGLGGVEMTPLSQLKSHSGKAAGWTSSDTLIARAKKAGGEEDIYAAAGINVVAADSDGEPLAPPEPKAPEPVVDDGPSDDPFDEDEEEASVKIPIRVVHYAAAAVIAFMVFAMAMPNVGKGEAGELNASAMQNGALHKLLSGPQETTTAAEAFGMAQGKTKATSETPTNKASVNEETTAGEASAKEMTAPAREAATAEMTAPAREAATATPMSPAPEAPKATAEKTVDPQPFYTLVLASMVTKTNGQAFADKLKGKGVKEARVYTQKGVNRVICGHYATEAEAYKALRQYRNTTSDFKEAWVYRAK